MRSLISLAVTTWTIVGSLHNGSHANDNASYQHQVVPILTKYCGGCHNEADREGDFSLTTLASLRAGTPDGSVLVPGNPDDSKLIQLIDGSVEPHMPPEGEPAPTKAEIELVRKWIHQGCHGPETGMELIAKLDAPRLTPAEAHHHLVGAACAIQQRLAIGKLGRVEMQNLDSGKTVWATGGLAGKVNSLRVSHDKKTLVVGGGIAGVGGEAVLLDVDSGKVLHRFEGHSDTIYCATLSRDGKWLFTGSYDREVILWEVSSGKQIRSFAGHNGAIYDLDVSPNGKVLATASADQTVKLWNTHSGIRLDTLGQPEGEMRCVRFTADGSAVLAGGNDRQIRKWKLVSRNQPDINPMLVARFAHESDVLHLRLLGDRHLLTASADRLVKLWDVAHLIPLGEVARLNESPIAVCAFGPSEQSPAEETQPIAVAVEIHGKTHSILRKDLQRAKRLQKQRQSQIAQVSPIVHSAEGSNAVTQVVQEVEPNDQASQATSVTLPLNLEGCINPDATPPNSGQHPGIRSEDVDLFHFSATQGQPWLIEVEAQSKKSKLDSRIDILDESGNPVLRTRLQAVRESYFTFRGKDSSTSDDFRMHKWEDMELDEYLYASGEITRLWHYPRGPDSGFRVYPGSGKRHTFFDTTPVSHALGEPAYVVRELANGEVALPNGLPVFPIYFENDDDGLRKAGKDSRLTFVAPESGDYFLRIRDARGFGSQEHFYSLTIRAMKPDFSIKIAGNQARVPIGSGREWSATVERIDGLSGPISIHLHNVPDGVVATNPLIIEAGQQTARGVLYATELAPLSPLSPESEPSQNEKEEKSKTSPAPVPTEISMTVMYGQGETQVSRALKDKIRLSVVEAQEVQLRLVKSDSDADELTELEIRPGETVSAKVVVQRNGWESRIGFGKDDSGRNLPHGAFVDNIGLNGLLITESQNEREFFVTAAPKVLPGRRQFHLRSETKGNPCSRPVWIHVLPSQP